VLAAAEVLSEHWCSYFEQGQKATRSQTTDIEKMLRATFVSIHQYFDEVENTLKPAHI
jgi:hypothetical protein